MSIVQDLFDIKEQLKEVRVIDIVLFIYVFKMDNRMKSMSTVLEVHQAKISSMWIFFRKHIKPVRELA